MSESDVVAGGAEEGCIVCTLQVTLPLHQRSPGVLPPPLFVGHNLQPSKGLFAQTPAEAAAC